MGGAAAELELGGPRGGNDGLAEVAKLQLCPLALGPHRHDAGWANLETVVNRFQSSRNPHAH